MRQLIHASANTCVSFNMRQPQHASASTCVSLNMRQFPGIFNSFMTMGDWIQGSVHGNMAVSYRPWTGTYPKLINNALFLRAGPSLPWPWEGATRAMGESTLPSVWPYVHVSGRYGPQSPLFYVQGHIPAGYYPSRPPWVHPSRHLATAR